MLRQVYVVAAVGEENIGQRGHRAPKKERADAAAVKLRGKLARLRYQLEAHVGYLALFDLRKDPYLALLSHPGSLPSGSSALSDLMPRA